MELKLIAVGDNLIHKEIFKSVRDSEGDYDFNPLYDPVRDAIQAAGRGNFWLKGRIE